MYDLINNWDELEALRSWQIDKRYDKELNEIEVTLTLNSDDNIIFQVYARFFIRNNKASSSVYIDTFNAWTLDEIEEGMRVLEMIKQKCQDFVNYCKDNHIDLQIGRV